MKPIWHAMQCVETYRVNDAEGMEIVLKRGQKYRVTRTHNGLRSVLCPHIVKVPAYLFANDMFSERGLRRIGSGPLSVWMPQDRAA